MLHFLAELDNPSGNSGKSGVKRPVSLATLDASVKNLHRLKEEAENVEKFLAQMDDFSDDSDSDSSEEDEEQIPVGSLAAFDESIRNLQQLKKKAEALDELLADIDSLVEASSEEADDPTMDLLKLKEENEKLEAFLTQLGEASGDASGDVDKAESDVSLATLQQSLKDFHKLQQENQRIGQFFTRLEAASGDDSGDAAVASLAIFDASIKNIDKLRKKTAELDRLFAEINESGEDSGEPDASGEPGDFNESMRNLMKLKEENDKVQKFLAAVNKPSAANSGGARGGNKNDASLATLDASVKNLHRLKEETDNVEKFLAQLDDVSDDSDSNSDCPEEEQQIPEGSLSEFDESIRNLQELKKKAEAFEKLLADMDRLAVASSEETEDSTKDLLKLKEENEKFRTFLGRLGDASGETSGDASGDASGKKKESDVSLAALRQSLGNLEKLQQENERMDQFFTQLEAASGGDSGEATEVAMAVFSDSIEKVKKLKKKTTELDQLMDKIHDADPLPADGDDCIDDVDIKPEVTTDAPEVKTDASEEDCIDDVVEEMADIQPEVTTNAPEVTTDAPEEDCIDDVVEEMVTEEQVIPVKEMVTEMPSMEEMEESTEMGPVENDGEQGERPVHSSAEVAALEESVSDLEELRKDYEELTRLLSQVSQFVKEEDVTIKPDELDSYLVPEEYTTVDSESSTVPSVLYFKYFTNEFN